jgi:Icc-related predicted phosphoesterase
MRFFLYCLLLVFALASAIETRQIHIAAGADPSSQFVVSWVSKDEGKPSVAYGLSKDDLSLLSEDCETTDYHYEASGFPSYDSDNIYHCYLEGLSPQTTYFYQAGNKDGDVSDVYSFTTLPPKGDKSALWLGVVGDLGQTQDSEVTLAQIADEDYQMLIFAGDLSYADRNQQRWDSWSDMVEYSSTTLPYMSCPGNHEEESSTSMGELFTSYRHRFRMPWVEQESDSRGFQDDKAYYSIDVGMVHMVFLNTFGDNSVGSPQYNWFVEDVQAVDRTETPWLIVISHAPWYNSNKAHHLEPQSIEQWGAFEGLFLEYNVNLFLSGHVHAYERSDKVYRWQPNEKGTVYIVTGEGGNREGHASTYYNQPWWSLYRNGEEFGHGALQVWNATHLTWQWKPNVDGLMTMRDEYTLENQYFL